MYFQKVEYIKKFYFSALIQIFFVVCYVWECLKTYTLWDGDLCGRGYLGVIPTEPRAEIAFQLSHLYFFILIYDMNIFLAIIFFESRNFTRPQNIYRVWHVRHVMLDMTSNFLWFMLCSWVFISENYFWIIASIFVLFHHSFSSFKIPITHVLNL